MQLKVIIKNMAKEKGISAQIILQNYILERLLERISISKYKSNFILKGGFLLAAMVGLDNRATMDMDATTKGLPFNEEIITEMFKVIANIPMEDEVIFEFIEIAAIRDNDEYGGYRISLNANYSHMTISLKVRITTGDKITPKEIKFSYKLMFESRSIDILAYNIETVLSEKLETIISRGDQNTRPRDYYDVYILKKCQYKNINIKILKEALIATATQKGTLEIIKKYSKIIYAVKNNINMRKQWESYRNTYDYAREIDFYNVCDVIIDLMGKIL